MLSLRAILELLRLAWITRGKFKGPYWTWRWHTALGSQGHALPRGQRWKAVWEYARWVASMRRER